MQSLLQLEIQHDMWEGIDEDILCTAEAITEEDKNRYQDDTCSIKQRKPVQQSSYNPQINERDVTRYYGKVI